MNSKIFHRLTFHFLDDEDLTRNKFSRKDKVRGKAKLQFIYHPKLIFKRILYLLTTLITFPVNNRANIERLNKKITLIINKNRVPKRIL